MRAGTGQKRRDADEWRWGHSLPLLTDIGFCPKLLESGWFLSKTWARAFEAILQNCCVRRANPHSTGVRESAEGRAADRQTRQALAQSVNTGVIKCKQNSQCCSHVCVWMKLSGENISPGFLTALWCILQGHGFQLLHASPLHDDYN